MVRPASLFPCSSDASGVPFLHVAPSKKMEGVGAIGLKQPPNNGDSKVCKCVPCRFQLDSALGLFRQIPVPSWNTENHAEAGVGGSATADPAGKNISADHNKRSPKLCTKESSENIQDGLRRARIPTYSLNNAKGAPAMVKDASQVAKDCSTFAEREKSKWLKLGLECSAMVALEEKLQEVAVSCNRKPAPTAVHNNEKIYKNFQYAREYYFN